MFSAVNTATLVTADDLLHMYLPDKQVELVRGHLVVREPPGTRHGWVAANLAYFISDFVRRHNLGAVFAQDTGFHIARDPDTVRAPDAAFVTRERLAAVGRRGYAFVAPDLVAEVLSPDDRPGEVLAKVGDWLSAGVRLVWIIDPERAAACVYRADGSVALLEETGVLEGEDVVPGFRCPVRDVLT
jgi:Uma2 family endonuclease